MFCRWLDGVSRVESRWHCMGMLLAGLSPSVTTRVCPMSVTPASRHASTSLRNHHILYITVSANHISSLPFLPLSKSLQATPGIQSQRPLYKYMNVKITESFIARQHIDARYRYSNSVCSLYVRLSVRDLPVSDENGLTHSHGFFHHTFSPALSF